jgi:hypothetical protein
VEPRFGRVLNSDAISVSPLVFLVEAIGWAALHHLLEWKAVRSGIKGGGTKMKDK